MIINGNTRLFGVLGNPVEHSLSPAMHNAAFRARGVDAVYIPLATSELETAFAGIKALPFTGVSVTVPHKVAIMPLLDGVDPVAQKIGAVNTLLFKQRADGRMQCTGVNTDWIGANRALEEVIPLKGASVLLLGAGGSARALGFGLKEVGAQVFLHNRTEAKGQQLAEQLECDYLTADQVQDQRLDILINATTVGMLPLADAIPLDADLLSNFQVVMDIVYAPLETKLLKEAAHRGCTTVAGSNMLLYQAVEQWRLWMEEDPPVEVMHTALIEGLKRQQENQIPPVE